MNISSSSYLLVLFLLLLFSEAADAQVFRKKKRAKPAPTEEPQAPVLRVYKEEHWQLNAKDAPLYIISEIHYDSLERIQSQKDYTEEGTIRRNRNYRYIDNGLRKQVLLSLPLVAGQEDYKLEEEIEYDSKGLCSKKRVYKREEGLVREHRYQYDTKGRLTQEQFFDAQKKKIQELSIVYDDELDKYTEYFTDLEHKRSYQTVVSLSAHQKPRIRYRYLSSGSLVDKTVFVRDEAGRLLKKQVYKSDDTDLGMQASYEERYSYPDEQRRIIRIFVDGEEVEQRLEKRLYKSY